MNVEVAVGAALATLLVAIIIVVVGYWFLKFKSEESGVSHQLLVTIAGGFTLYTFSYILNLNKNIYCFAMKNCKCYICLKCTFILIFLLSAIEVSAFDYHESKNTTCQ